MMDSLEELTPRQIVAELDRYIIGQDDAKRAVAVALRNRYRRQRLSPEDREDVMPKNILMMGPTGVGKTEIARRLAQLAHAPFIKVEATKFTEVGYVGRDVESMIRDLIGISVRLVEKERVSEVRKDAVPYAEDRLLDLLEEAMPHRYTPRMPVPQPDEESPYPFFHENPEIVEARAVRRARLKLLLEGAKLDNRLIEVDTEEQGSGFLQVFTPQGMEEMGIDGLPGNLGGGPKRVRRRTTVREAREVLIDDECKRMVDQTSIRHEAVHRCEQSGIIFIDEIDKVAIKSSGSSGPDVSREGVQRDLLPIVEGSTVQTKFGPVRTDHILFIAAGAFHIAKPTDLIPELQGRFPIRVELQSLSQSDFRKILKEPKNALVAQYQKLLGADGVDLQLTEDALEEVATIAAALNEKTQDIGARRLHTVMELLLQDILFQAPDAGLKSVVIDAVAVRSRLEPVLTPGSDVRYKL